MAKVWGDFPRVYEAAHRDSSSWKGIVLLYLYNSVAEQYTLAYKEIIWGCIDHPWDHVEGVHKSWFPATSKRLYKHEPLTFHPDRPNSLLFVFWLKGTLPNLDVQLSDCGCFLQKGIVVVVVVVLDLFSICCFRVLTNSWSSAASSQSHNTNQACLYDVSDCGGFQRGTSCEVGVERLKMSWCHDTKIQWWGRIDWPPRICIHEVLVRWRNGRFFFWHCWCVFCIWTLSHGEQSENASSCGSLKPIYHSQNVCGHVWPKQLMSKFTESAVHPLRLSQCWPK